MRKPSRHGLGTKGEYSPRHCGECGKRVWQRNGVGAPRVTCSVACSIKRDNRQRAERKLMAKAPAQKRGPYRKKMAKGDSVDVRT